MVGGKKKNAAMVVGYKLVHAVAVVELLPRHDELTNCELLIG